MHYRVALLVLVMATLAFAGPAFVNYPAREAASEEAKPREATPAVEPTTVGEMQVTQGWLWDLFSGRSRERSSDFDDRRRPDPEDRSRWDGWGGQDLEGRRPDTSGTLRALCVRLCDGFPFPISNATTRTRFSTNARQCEQSCPGRSRLFVGEGPEDMVDLQGQPYRELATAFRYRTEYDASCTCRGNPWDEAALARHRAYAEAEKTGKAKPPAAAQMPAKSQEVSRRERRDGRSSRTARSDWQRDDDD